MRFNISNFFKMLGNLTPDARHPAPETQYPKPNTQRPTSAYLFVVFLAALLLRLLYIWQSRSNPLFGFPVVDAQTYHEWAVQMAGGRWLWHHVHNYLPVYPAFLALQNLILGESPWVYKIVQSLMGALSAVMIARIAAGLWNRRVGLIAGLLAATWWMPILYESEMYAESFSLFFQSLTLWIFIRFGWHGWCVLLAGFSFALSAGARANLFLILPFILIWLIGFNRAHLPSAIKTAFLFLLGSLLLIGPIVYRNDQITGTPMLRSQAGWSLYSALDPRFGGLHPPAGILFKKEIRRPFLEGLRSEADFDRYWFARARTLIDSHREEVLRNQIHRLLIFFNAREWSQEFDVYAYRSYASVLRLPWPGFWLIGPLGMLGLLLVRRMRPEHGFLILYLTVSMISIFPFKASDRYRLPFILLMIPFAAFALYKIYEWVKREYRPRVVMSILLFLAFGVLCWPDWANLNARKTSRHFYYAGLAHDAAGRESDAIAAFKTSMEKFPWDPDSPYHIGHILARQKKYADARRYLGQALIEEPDFPEAYLDLARIALIHGDFQESEKMLQRSLERYPNFMEALLFGIEMHRRRGDPRHELEYFRRAVFESRFPSMRDGGFADMAIRYSLRLAELGHTDQALIQLDEVVRARSVEKEKQDLARKWFGSLSARR